MKFRPLQITSRQSVQVPVSYACRAYKGGSQRLSLVFNFNAQVAADAKWTVGDTVKLRLDVAEDGSCLRFLQLGRGSAGRPASRRKAGRWSWQIPYAGEVTRILPETRKARQLIVISNDSDGLVLELGKEDP